MKKSTIFLLVAVVVLAVVTFVVTRKGSEPPTPKLGLRGYATTEQLAADKTRGMMEAPVDVPNTIDEIIIERDATNPKAGSAPRIHLAREGYGEAAKWKLVEPVEAPAQKYQVERIVQLFKGPATSKFARVLKDSDLARYDLEPARRIHLTLEAKGQLWQGPPPDPKQAASEESGVTWADVDLMIGRVEKGDADERGNSSSDTWVTTAADPKTAYLIAGKDLRSALDVDLAALRDKKVFTLDPNDISKLEIAAPDGTKVVLTGTRSETPAPPPEDGAPPPPEPPKPTVKVTWAISSPPGVTADSSVDAYARSFANLTAQEFVPLAGADEAGKKALAGKTWTVTATVTPKDGAPATIALKIADGEGDTIWAELEGQTAGREELIKLASHSAASLRKGLDELEDKVVFDVPPESVSALTVKGDTGPITVTRAADGKSWAFTAPALPYAADPTNLLRQIGKLSITRWAKPSERDQALAALATIDTEAVLTTADGKVRTVRFAKAAPDQADQGRWGVVLEGAADMSKAKPFLAPDHAIKRFETSVAGLRWKRVIAGEKGDIKRVEITSADGKETFTLERPPADPGAPAQELAVVNAPAGKVTKDETARTLASTLAALDAKSYYDGKAVAESGLEPGKVSKVVVTLDSGAQSTLLVSTKKPAEGEVFAVVDQGPLAGVVVGINEYQAKNLTRALSEFLEDAKPAEAPPAP